MILAPIRQMRADRGSNMIFAPARRNMARRVDKPPARYALLRISSAGAFAARDKGTTWHKQI